MGFDPYSSQTTGCGQDVLALLWGGTNVSTSVLTTGLPLLVEQDAIHRGPDQNVSTCLLNDRDDVKGKLAGTPTWIICATLVVMKKERVDEETGIFWRDT